MKFDEIDLRILHDLQDDGRVTNVELAKRCHISAPPCLRRMRYLEDAGIIKGYHAHIDPHAMGYTVMVLAQVSLKTQNDEDLRAFERDVAHWDEVRECYLMSGGADYFLKVYTKNWDDYHTFHAHTLSTHTSVQHIQTNVVMRTSKSKPGIPIDMTQPAGAYLSPKSHKRVEMESPKD